MKPDLHMHSDISLDGEYPPEKLAALCAENGIDFAALTDHNSVRGVRRFREAAQKTGLRTMTGIELDCVFDGVELHLLGYGVDITDKRYARIEEEVLRQKRAVSHKRMEILKELGVHFEEDAVLGLARDGIVVGEMIAEAALCDERNRENPLLSPYRPGGGRSGNPYVNFFWDFCAQGKPAFLPVRYMSFEEALFVIRDTGGFAVIAHPVNTVGRREDMIARMTACGVEGIEVFSSYHSPEDVAYYRGLAARLGLMMTGGSDFHGKTKPSVRPGETNGMTDEDRIALQRMLCAGRADVWNQLKK